MINTETVHFLIQILINMFAANQVEIVREMVKYNYFFTTLTRIAMAISMIVTQ